MPTITLKNIPRELHRSLKSQAKAHHRSLNKEMIAKLESSVQGRPQIEAETALAQARAMRSKFKRKITLKEIQAWKGHGRK